MPFPKTKMIKKETKKETKCWINAPGEQVRVFKRASSTVTVHQEGYVILSHVIRRKDRRNEGIEDGRQNRE